jgi:hypothetical protein
MLYLKVSDAHSYIFFTMSRRIKFKNEQRNGMQRDGRACFGELNGILNHKGLAVLPPMLKFGIGLSKASPKCLADGCIGH